MNKLNKDIYKIQYEFAKKETLSNNAKLNKATSKLQDFQKNNKILNYNQQTKAILFILY